MSVTEKKNFIGGLNSDAEDRKIPQGDYRYALNVRSSLADGANEGAIENTKGNAVADFLLPVGNNRCIGALDDEENNMVYFFVFNDFGNHTIYEYDVSANVVSIVLQTPILNFKSNKFINDPVIIGGLLYFNDRVNPPRKVNIERAKTNGYPSAFREEFINQIAYAPGFPPEVAYGDDTTIKTNNVRNKLFQFRYKYIYEDNEESAWSPISKVPLPQDEGTFRPFAYYDPTKNNKIGVTVNLGDEFVKRVKIAFRESNTGDFFLADDIDKSKLTLPLISLTYTYDFYNDETPIALDNDGNSGMRLFDNVPQLADSQALIDGNRIAHGGITENYDPVDIDIDVDVTRDFSDQVPSPELTRTIPADFPGPHGYGSTHGGVYYALPSTQHARIIGGNTYYLDQFAQQLARPGQQSSQAFLFLPQQIPNAGPFTSGDLHDRLLIMTNPGNGYILRTGGSLVNEITIGTPPASGVRYVMEVKVQYHDIGNTDALKSKTFKVQYNSQVGDTAQIVATQLKNKIAALTFTDGLVQINFAKSSVGSFSRGLNASVAPKESLEIWGEAFVPNQNIQLVGNPPFDWPTATGPDTGAIYQMEVEIKGLADWTSNSEKTLKAGANHGIGIVYYDAPNRSGLTNISRVSQEKTFYVPHFAELNIPSGQVPNATDLRVTINHKPPEWARRYQFVYTGNQTITRIPASEGYRGFVDFTLKNVSNSSISGAIQATLDNLVDYNDAVPEDIDLGYSYTKGDRIRFVTKAVNTTTLAVDYLTDYRDVEVVSFDPNTNIIVFKDPSINIVDNMLVEIYTPKTASDDLVYHEIGECFDIIGGFHTGNVSDQSNLAGAVVDLNDIGDVYLRYRTGPIFSIVEDYSFSDYYTSDSWDMGRPNIVDNNIKRVKRESTIRYSEPFVPETNINGLSQFNDLSFEVYAQRYGSIQRMYSKDRNLIIFQNDKVGRIGVNQSTLFDNQGNPIGAVGQQTKVLNDVNYYIEEFGIGTNPESFAVYGNRMYFVDVKRGAVLRLGGDGITTISDYKMHNYFTDTFKAVIDAKKDFKVIGEYDIRFGEYILSIQGDLVEIPAIIVAPPEDPIKIGDGGSAPPSDDPVDIGLGIEDPSSSGEIEIGGPALEPTIVSETAGEELTPVDPDSGSELVIGDAGSGSGAGDTPADPGGEDPSVPVIPPTTGVTDTIAFSEIKKRWTTFYSYVPDYMITNNIGLITFSKGLLYKHNASSFYCNFYGVQYTMKMRFLSNIEPSYVKVFNNIFVEASHKFSAPSITNKYGQQSTLILDDFEDREGVFKAAFWKDSATPNTTNPLIEGDELRCHSLDVTLENADTELVVLSEVGVGIDKSELTNR
jgi:hypothetical protein